MDTWLLVVTWVDLHSEREEIEIEEEEEEETEATAVVVGDMKEIEEIEGIEIDGIEEEIMTKREGEEEEIDREVTEGIEETEDGDIKQFIR